MTVLALKVLGGFEARDAAGQTIEIGSKKSCALLSVLALAPGGSLPRDRLARLLWSDRGDDQARSSLRQSLAVLRKDLGAPAADSLIAGDSRIRLDLDRTEIEAIAFQRLAGAGDLNALRAAAELYRGDLLADIEIRDTAFQEWLRSERRRLSDLAVQVLERLWTLESGATRVRIAQRLVTLDSLRESAHRKLIQAYFEMGERASALRQFDICRDMLRTEFNVAPDRETSALRDSLQDSGLKRVGDAPADSRVNVAEVGYAGEKPSIAVLPFDVMTGVGELELKEFSEGLTEDITTALSRIRAIRVVARNSAFAVRERPLDIRAIGSELDARYVLEGSVRRFGPRFRVTAQLIEASSGHHVWAHRFDRESSGDFELQDDITGAIVASVQTQIILHEGRSIREEAADTAPRLLVRSWQQFLGLSEQSLASSRALAERALALDSSSGMAHRMMAVCLYHQALMGMIPWTEALVEDVFAYARFSVESEDVDEYSHWAMECAHLLRKEHARAMRSLQHALDINPHCSLAHGSIGTVLAWSGQHVAAVKSNELALRMNPDDPANFFRHLGLALANYLAGSYNEALTHSISVLQNRPRWWLGLILNIASSARLGSLDDASRMLSELERIRPGTTCSSLSILPFANDRDRQHLFDGLRKAGMLERTAP